MRTMLSFSIVLVAIGCERQPQAALPTETANIAPKETVMDWDDPLDPVAVTVPDVVAGKTSIVLVIHDSGHGGWQFMDGQDVKGSKPAVIPKEVLLRLDPSLAELKDLPVGWRARRASSKVPWIREKNPTAE